MISAEVLECHFDELGSGHWQNRDFGIATRSTLATPLLDFSKFLIRNPVSLEQLAESIEAKWNFAIKVTILRSAFLYVTLI